MYRANRGDVLEDFSLQSSIKNSSIDVKSKINFLDYARTPDRVLKKIGLENEAKFLRNQQEKYLMELPKNIDKITEWSKRVSKESNRRIFDYLDGKAIDLQPNEKQVASEIRIWLEK